MTLVPIALTSPAHDGTQVPARGVLRFTPTARRVLDDTVVLPIPFQAALVLGAAVVDLAPNDLTWVWRIDEHVAGSPSRTIYVNVSGVTVNYADLVPIDPDTLAPSSTPPAAWTVALGNLDTRLSAGTITPDPDDPGFFLIGAS